MKQADIKFIILVILIVLSFVPFSFLETYHSKFLFNPDFWYISGFLKFAILATLGESLGLRITKGVYNEPGFGLIPRAVIWGFIGVTINIAFVVFAVGTPAMLHKLFGMQNAVEAMKASSILDAAQQGLATSRIITAFSISTFMNLVFAPVFMTFHKITDTHIVNHKGKIKALFTPIKFKKIIPDLNWEVQWNFVFKKTIPFFWIPAHTITFLLPGEYRIIFAAVLGIILGVILSFAINKK
jgi:hypothetical protein